MPTAPTIADVIAFLERFAPPALAESWDNVGLLLGDRSSPFRRAMTCLTLTEDVAEEAVRGQVDLIVTHHPVFFRPVKRLTSDTPEGRTMLALARVGVAVYSPHTSFDSASEGINQQLAVALGLADIQPLRPPPQAELPGGGGRIGRLPAEISLEKFATRVGLVLSAGAVAYTGEPAKPVRRVAVACGAAAEFLEDALAAGCDVLLTGEARFHASLEARARGIGLVLAGHYATERPAVEQLAQVLAQNFPGCPVWASRVETDPLNWSIL